jgi:hypothetical protein
MKPSLRKRSELAEAKRIVIPAKAGIQYAAVSQFYYCCPWILIVYGYTIPFFRSVAMAAGS